ncbi:aldo/keto reductase [Salinimicrobium soli]|uniref:aldo/keto reductase n=1 Tax=Salinimicrobium soli TaxID=1254399 RepID=UPI003AAE0EA6
MRQKKSYSRLIQNLQDWEKFPKGTQIHLLQHCVERDITSFYTENLYKERLETSLGTALSESGLSRDEIQVICRISDEDLERTELETLVENCLLNLRTDYIDLLILDDQEEEKRFDSEIEKLRSRGQVEERGRYKANINLPENENFPEDISALLGDWKVSSGAIKNLSAKDPVSGKITEILKMEFSEDILGVQLLMEMGTKYDLSEKEVVLCWLLNHPNHYHPLIHARSVDAIDNAFKAHRVKMIGEDWKKFAEKI